MKQRVEAYLVEKFNFSFRVTSVPPWNEENMGAVAIGVETTTGETKTAFNVYTRMLGYFIAGNDYEYRVREREITRSFTHRYADALLVNDLSNPSFSYFMYDPETSEIISRNGKLWPGMLTFSIQKGTLDLSGEASLKQVLQLFSYLQGFQEYMSASLIAPVKEVQIIVAVPSVSVFFNPEKIHTIEELRRALSRYPNEDFFRLQKSVRGDLSDNPPCRCHIHSSQS